MHHVLSIPELVLEIVEGIPNEVEKLKFGLTCKAIFNVAVSSIWCSVVENVEGDELKFRPLLPAEVPKAPRLRSLLPPDVTYDHESSLASKTVVLSRALEEHEWLPVLEYGPHIRHLKWPRLRDALILTTYSGPALLLPRLQSLHLNLGYKTLLACLPFVKERQLCHININLHDSLGMNSPAISSFLQSFQVSDRLHTFEFTYHSMECWAWKSVDGVNEFLTLSSPFLRKFAYCCQDDGVMVLKRAARLPLLEVLCMEVHPFDEVEIRDITPIAFPSLRTLSIHSKYSYNWIVLFENMSSVFLEQLIFTITLSSVREVLEVIAEKWSFTLTELTLHVDVEEETEYHDPYSRPAKVLSADQLPKRVVSDISWDTVLPLAACRGLRIFHVTSEGHGMGFSDNCVESMTASWPELRSFSAYEYWSAPKELKTTRRSLAYFARCRALHDLVIAIDYDRPEGPFDPEKVLYSPSSLHSLHNLHSTCSSPIDAADFLRTTFPNLKTFGCSQWAATTSDLQRILGLEKHPGIQIAGGMSDVEWCSL